jgi:hypothetical protein
MSATAFAVNMNFSVPVFEGSVQDNIRRTAGPLETPVCMYLLNCAVSHPTEEQFS